MTSMFSVQIIRSWRVRSVMGGNSLAVSGSIRHLQNCHVCVSVFVPKKKELHSELNVFVQAASFQRLEINLHDDACDAAKMSPSPHFLS